MYKVSSTQINQLRTKTGAGMMECKKALIESQGDFEKAIEFLRIKGQKIALGRLDRNTSEGIVVSAISKDNTSAVIFSLNCETDFVAKNQDFKSLAYSIADKALDCDSLEELLELSFEKNLSIKEKLIEQTGIIGEKLQIAAFEKLQAPFVCVYIHHNQEIASMIAFSSYIKGIEQIGKDVAMQVAAMNPISLDERSMSIEIIEKEKEISKEQLRKEGRPENMLDKIAEGKLRKFFAENTLIHQAFLKDQTITIDQYVKNFDKNLYITNFKRISVKK